MIKPWPERVEPVYGEALSSWMTRVGRLYDISFNDMVDFYLGSVSGSYELNLTKDHSLIRKIAQLSRLSFDEVRSMTFCGVVPYAFSGEFDDFGHYVLGRNVILGDWGEWGGVRGRALSWRPWISRSGTRACPACVEEGEVIALRLEWIMPIASCCAKHCLPLVECEISPGQYVSWKKDEYDFLTPEMIYLDSITQNALAEGKAEVFGTYITAAVWFRLLRTAIEEVIAPAYVHQSKRRLIIDIWDEAGCRVPYLINKTFENMPWPNQRKILKAASIAIRRKAEELERLWTISVAAKKGYQYFSDKEYLRNYFWEVLKSEKWKSVISIGGYKMAKENPYYASLLRSTLYWQSDVSVERAWKAEEYLKLNGVGKFSLREIRMVESYVTDESWLYFELPADGSWRDVRGRLRKQLDD